MSAGEDVSWGETRYRAKRRRTKVAAAALDAAEETLEELDEGTGVGDAAGSGGLVVGGTANDLADLAEAEVAGDDVVDGLQGIADEALLNLGRGSGGGVDGREGQGGEGEESGLHFGNRRLSNKVTGNE